MEPSLAVAAARKKWLKISYKPFPGDPIHTPSGAWARKLEACRVAVGSSRSQPVPLYGEADVSPEEIRRWFAHAEAHIVEMNDRVVGYMDVERRAGGRIQVDVCVHPDAWESTTADALIDAAEAWARANSRKGDFLRAFAFEREDYLRQALEKRGYRFRLRGGRGSLRPLGFPGRAVCGLARAHG